MEVLNKLKIETSWGFEIKNIFFLYFKTSRSCYSESVLFLFVNALKCINIGRTEHYDVEKQLKYERSNHTRYLTEEKAFDC